MQTIHDRIWQRLQDLELNQGVLHRKTGASRSAVSGWVNGRTSPSSKYLEAIAQVLKCDVDWLVSGKGDMNGNNTQSSTVHSNYVANHHSMQNNYTIGINNASLENEKKSFHW